MYFRFYEMYLPYFLGSTECIHHVFQVLRNVFTIFSRFYGVYIPCIPCSTECIYHVFQVLRNVFTIFSRFYGVYLPYFLGSTECIPVEGTRYDVLIPQRIKRSVYWAGEVDFLEQIILKKNIFTLLRMFSILPLNEQCLVFYLWMNNV